MNNKFIQLTVEQDKLFVNPHLITCIKTVGSSKSGFRSIVYTMDGIERYVLETIEEIHKKIKESDRFLISNFDL